MIKCALQLFKKHVFLLLRGKCDMYSCTHGFYFYLVNISNPKHLHLCGCSLTRPVFLYATYVSLSSCYLCSTKHSATLCVRNKMTILWTLIQGNWLLEKRCLVHLKWLFPDYFCALSLFCSQSVLMLLQFSVYKQVVTKKNFS